MQRRRFLVFGLGAPAYSQITTEEAQERQNRYLITDFRDRFNDLSAAMVAFAAKFNPSHGLVWPRKEASGLLKAMRRLESAEAFLKEKE